MGIHSSPSSDFAGSTQKWHRASAYRFVRALLFPEMFLAASCLAAFTSPILAQPTTAQPVVPATGAPRKSTHTSKHSSAAHTATAEAPAADAAPAAPPAPKWPAFDQPAQASVVWDSRGLSIDAANSSLSQILKEVSTATGVNIQGINGDQRVFGTYGPGPARDVLAQVLQGSGYNVIMVGDQGQGVPRELLLSPRQGTTQQAAVRNNPAPNNDDDDSSDDQPVQQEMPVIHPSYQPGAPPRSPQQILQEMQQRQQQMQQPGQPQPPN